MCIRDRAFDPVSGEDNAVEQQEGAVVAQTGGILLQPLEAPLPPLSFPASPPSVARLHLLSDDLERTIITAENVRRVYADLRQQRTGGNAGGGGGGGDGDGGGSTGSVAAAGVAGAAGAPGAAGVAEEASTSVHRRQAQAEIREAGKNRAINPSGSSIAKACLEPFKGHTHSSSSTDGLDRLAVDNGCSLTTERDRKSKGTPHGGAPPPVFPNEVARLTTLAARAGNQRRLGATTITGTAASPPTLVGTQHIISEQKTSTKANTDISKEKVTCEAQNDIPQDKATPEAIFDVAGDIYSTPTTKPAQAHVVVQEAAAVAAAAAAAAAAVQPGVIGGGRSHDVVPAVGPQAAKLSTGLGAWANQAAAVGRLVDKNSRRVAEEISREAEKQQGLKRALEQEMGSAIKSLPLSFLKDKGYKREAQREGLERVTKVVDRKLFAARSCAWKR